MTNEKEIIRILAPYLVAYPQCKVTAEALIVYANALKTLSLTQIQMAMDKLIRTSKFFPSVAEIYEATSDITNYVTDNSLPLPSEAWEEVMKQAKKNFIYAKWDFSCKEVELAAKRFGIMELCSLESKDINIARAQFFRIYSEICSQKQNNELNEKVMASLPQNKIKQLAENIALIH